MNEYWLRTHWNEVKNDVPQHWERLTLLDIEIIQGRKKNLEAVLCKRYGLDSRAAQHAVEEWVRCLSPGNDATSEAE